VTVFNESDIDWLLPFGNVAPGVTAAIKAAAAASTCTPGDCLGTVRGWWRIPAGAPSAIAAWRAVPAAERHSFYTPPAGVPVFWSGGAEGYGHVGLSLGNGYVRETDVGGEGQVHTTLISEIHTEDSKLVYLGWTESLNGVKVYTPNAA
jgi:cell wall-associated NlpC family hydrolase